jgi:hypothetical protein
MVEINTEIISSYILDVVKQNHQKYGKGMEYVVVPEELSTAIEEQNSLMLEDWNRNYSKWSNRSKHEMEDLVSGFCGGDICWAFNESYNKRIISFDTGIFPIDAILSGMKKVFTEPDDITIFGLIKTEMTKHARYVASTIDSPEDLVRFGKAFTKELYEMFNEAYTCNRVLCNIWHKRNLL